MVGNNPELNTTGTKLAKVIRWEKSTLQFSLKIDTKKAWEGNGLITTINVRFWSHFFFKKKVKKLEETIIFHQ